MPPRPPPVLRPTTTRSTRGTWRRRDHVVRLARFLLLSSPPTWIYHSWSLVSLVLHTLPHCTFARSLFHARFVAPTLITLHHLPLNDLTISAPARPLSRNNTTPIHIIMRYSSAMVLSTFAVGQAAAAHLHNRHASFHARRQA
jgi:hypothetical protein